jgi:hypothetical protein
MEMNRPIILTYFDLPHRNTRDPLYRLTTAAMDYLRDECKLMWTVMEAQDDPVLTEIWNKPTKHIPKMTVNEQLKQFRSQSPREYLEGFMEKINRTWGTDLSKKQLDGFYNLHTWFVEQFDLDEILFCDQDALFKDSQHYKKIQQTCIIK